MDSYVLLAYVYLAALGTLLQQSLACLNFFKYFFILLLQTKKMISRTIAAAQSAENHGDTWGLT